MQEKVVEDGLVHSIRSHLFNVAWNIAARRRLSWSFSMKMAYSRWATSKGSKLDAHFTSCVVQRKSALTEIKESAVLFTSGYRKLLRRENEA